MGEKYDNTLVNPNQMRHHCINVQDNSCMHNPMGIACPQEDVTFPLYISGRIFCSDTLSPTQQPLECCPWIVLTSQHDWDPHHVRFPKGSHSKEEEDLFSGISEIRVDILWSKLHETEIDPGLRNILHNLSFIATRLVSQVRIADAKVLDATKIIDLDEEVFEGQRQEVPYHRTLTLKEKHSDVNPYYLGEICMIGLCSATKTLKVMAQSMLQLAIMNISRQYRSNRMFEIPRIKGWIFTDTMTGQYNSLDVNRYSQVFNNDYFLLPHTPWRERVYQDSD